MVTEAPAARAYLTQADERWPGRLHKSDGILPSAEHTKANPTSFHELGNAVDLTVGGPVDGPAEFERLRQQAINGDRRILELIHNRKIATRARGWTVRDYHGDNPHTKHLHMSLAAAFRNDTSPWWPTHRPAKATTPALQEDDVFVVIDDDKKDAWLVNPWRREKRPIEGAELTLLSAGLSVVRGVALRPLLPTVLSYKSVG